MKPRNRPLSDDQLIEILVARWKNEPHPAHCPVCGEKGCETREEYHEYGSALVAEHLGEECRNCGMICVCADCGGWHCQRWDDETAPEDIKPYLCSCPITSASAYDPGTLTS